MEVFSKGQLFTEVGSVAPRSFFSWENGNRSAAVCLSQDDCGSLHASEGGGFGSANLCGAGTVGYQMIRGERVLFLMWPGQITAGHGDLWKRTSECESGGALTSEVYAGAVALLIYCNEEDIRGKASLLHSSSTINEPPPPPPCLATPQYFLP